MRSVGSLESLTRSQWPTQSLPCVLRCSLFPIPLRHFISPEGRVRWKRLLQLIPMPTTPLNCTITTMDMPCETRPGSLTHLTSKGKPFPTCRECTFTFTPSLPNNQRSPSSRTYFPVKVAFYASPRLPFLSFFLAQSYFTCCISHFPIAKCNSALYTRNAPCPPMRNTFVLE